LSVMMHQQDHDFPAGFMPFEVIGPSHLDDQGVLGSNVFSRCKWLCWAAKDAGVWGVEQGANHHSKSARSRVEGERLTPLPRLAHPSR
jgi:hypothetical protein